MHEKTFAILKKYEHQFAEIIDLCSKPSFSRGEKELARQLLRKLKDDLERDCHELHRRDQIGQLDTSEQSYLWPALREAKAKIVTPVNSTPDGKWVSDLSGAQLNITWMLSQIQEAE